NWAPPTHDGGNPVQKPIVEAAHRVTHLTEDVEYEFRVYAVNDAGVSNPSNISMPIKCAEPTEEPDGPSIINVTDTTNTSVSLEWTRPGYDGGMEVQGYIIEMCKATEEEWRRINEDLCTVTKYTATGLETGAEYKFRIIAINAIGKGKPKEISEPVKAVDRLTAPEIEIDASFQQTHIVKSGGSVCLRIAFKGKPAPSASWVKVDGELGVMADVTTTENVSCLTLENCTRNDSGKYTLVLENSSGSKSITFTVKVLDTPGAPGDFKVKDVNRGALTLTWEPPLNDGGARVHHYLVEKPKGTDKWVVAGATKNLTHTVERLTEGTEYEFRVKAKNDAGFSEPKEAFSSVIVKEPRIEPTADLSGITNQLITCKTGASFEIDVPFSGRPAPKVTWKLEEMRLKETDRVSIKTTKNRTTLAVKESMRGDGGRYFLTLENVTGVKTFTITVNVIAKQVKPQRELWLRIQLVSSIQIQSCAI
uniref:Titin n=1 Tax=Astyanax mexicanus TaxID=7994 RepID=A0A8B9H2H3_ASTMX